MYLMLKTLHVLAVVLFLGNIITGVWMTLMVLKPAVPGLGG